jgi:hypothetical protein
MITTHEFGATNEPNTCLWCGRQLYRNSTWESVRVETKHGYRGKTVGTLTERRGFEGNGFFCTRRCGEAFGIAMAHNGRRLQPASDTAEQEPAQ